MPFSTRFLAVGGSGSYTFTMSAASVVQDMLPPGFTLTSDGVLSGTTTSTGVYSFVLRVQDTAGNSLSRDFSLQVNSPSGLRVLSLNPLDSWTGFGRRRLLLTTNGSSTYTWSVVAGALPPGVSLVPGLSGPNTTSLAGAPAVAGIYTFTLRATDTANGAVFAERVFTQRVGSTQLVSPPVAIAPTADLPGGELGIPYSFALKAAGGAPPYTFSQSPFVPLPPGLSLSAAGVVSGTPSAIGTFSPCAHRHGQQRARGREFRARVGRHARGFHAPADSGGLRFAAQSCLGGRPVQVPARSDPSRRHRSVHVERRICHATDSERIAAGDTSPPRIQRRADVSRRSALDARDSIRSLSS